MREADVLLACCRWPPSQAASHQPPAGVGAELDWAAVLHLARRHQVLALVAHTLLAGWSDQLPAAMREHVQGYLAAVSLRNTYMATELLGLLDAFERAGIVAIAFKGPLLALDLYGDLAARDFSDLDLLIAARDVHAANELLRGRGYQLDPPLDPEQAAAVAGLDGPRQRAYLRSRAEHHFVRAGDSLTVDLHLALADPYIRFRLGFEELLRRSRWLCLQGTRCGRSQPRTRC